MPPRKLRRLSGKVARRVVRIGTAAEYNAVVLLLKNGNYVILQRVGGNPFNDRKTHRLVGHRVRMTGFRIGNVFRFIEAKVRDT